MVKYSANAAASVVMAIVLLMTACGLLVFGQV